MDNSHPESAIARIRLGSCCTDFAIGCNNIIVRLISTISTDEDNRSFAELADGSRQIRVMVSQADVDRPAPLPPLPPPHNFHSSPYTSSSGFFEPRARKKQGTAQHKAIHQVAGAARCKTAGFRFDAWSFQLPDFSASAIPASQLCTIARRWAGKIRARPSQ